MSGCVSGAIEFRRRIWFLFFQIDQSITRVKMDNGAFSLLVKVYCVGLVQKVRIVGSNWFGGICILN